MMLNSVPAAKEISDCFAPNMIVTGWHLNLKHIKAGFGDYIEASTDDTITNDMKFCTQGNMESCHAQGNKENRDFRNKLEFWDCLKQKYSLGNDDLDLGYGKVKEELVSNFTHISAEIPGVRMASHVQPDGGAVEAPL
eukprot:5032657-Ditylum_brightwellii.AAC.1